MLSTSCLISVAELWPIALSAHNQFVLRFCPFVRRTRDAIDCSADFLQGLRGRSFPRRATIQPEKCFTYYSLLSPTIYHYIYLFTRLSILLRTSGYRDYRCLYSCDLRCNSPPDVADVVVNISAQAFVCCRVKSKIKTWLKNHSRTTNHNHRFITLPF